jgi:hypothetical protein
MATIILSQLDSEDMNFLLELKSYLDRWDILDDVEEHWSNAMAEGEISDGALLNGLMQVATEEGKDEELRTLFE